MTSSGFQRGTLKGSLIKYPIALFHGLTEEEVWVVVLALPHVPIIFWVGVRILYDGHGTSWKFAIVRRLRIYVIVENEPPRIVHEHDYVVM